MDKKALVRKYRGAVRFLCGVHNAPSRLAVRSRGKGNRVIAPCALLKHVKIRFNGSGNTVIVGDFSRLDHVELYISGNDNVVEIGPWCTLVKTVFCTEERQRDWSLSSLLVSREASLLTSGLKTYLPISRKSREHREQAIKAMSMYLA